MIMSVLLIFFKGLNLGIDFTEGTRFDIAISHLSNKDIKIEKIKDIIDSIGLLSSIYKYGTLSYIGGGFGTGIHNILESAAFDVPVVFGPNYQKFNEAKELINSKLKNFIKYQMTKLYHEKCGITFHILQH